MDKKYRTRDGRDVCIISVDGRDKFSVVGYIGGSRELSTWDKVGQYFTDTLNSKMDLIEVPRTAGEKKMNWDWHWISWLKGTPFQWGEFKLNSGNPYKSYRFGPLLIRVFLRRSNVVRRPEAQSSTEAPEHVGGDG